MDWFLREPLPTRTWPVWARYAATLTFVALVTLFEAWLWPRFGGYPFLFFLLTIMAAGLLFDRGSGFLALAASLVIVAYLFLAPFGEMAVAEQRDFLALVLFAGVGILTASSIEMMHVSVHRLYRANQSLIASEREKDILLRDCNHRTRNHLAMLAAMIRLQEQEVSEPAARTALNAMGERVQVMVKVHERLMQVGGNAVVDTGTFIAELCADLKTSLMGLRPITLSVEAESHYVSQQTAVSIGLFINEFLTNALKYAFPQDRAGDVTVAFAKEGDAFRLAVTDNGVGYVSDQRPKPGSLGQRLVRSLAAQYGGLFEIGPRPDGPGTTAIVRFPVADETE